jgi:sulfite exporter TauE/SafE
MLGSDAVTYLVPFVGGLAGSLHCVGMCGAFPLALGIGAERRNVLRQLLYNLGRVNTLVAIGALAGAGGAVAIGAGPIGLASRVLAIVTGSIMVAVGLETLGVLVRVSALGAALARATVGHVLSGVITSNSPAAPLALGVMNAFLPCHLIYAFAAQAAATASPGAGALTMLAFGLGTVPAMLALGLTRALARPGIRAPLARAAGVLVIALGLVTVLRGLGPVGHAH